MAQKEFPLLSHPSPLPLVSRSDKQPKEPVKEPIFYNINCTVYLLYITLFPKFIISSKFVLYMGDHLIKDSSFDWSSLGEYFFLEFSETL